MSFLGSAEKLFWDNTAEGWQKAKARAKPKIHGIGIRWFRMKPDEVIAELEKMGVKISRQTLLNYEKWELIPKPKRGGSGKGKGRFTEYPGNTSAEAFASYKILHGKDIKVSPQHLAEIIRYFRNKENCYDYKNPYLNSKASIYTIWVIYLAEVPLKKLKILIEEKTNIKAQSIKTIIEPKPGDKEAKFQIEAAEQIEKRNHGDIKITLLNTEGYLIEYWNEDHKAWIAIEL